MENFIKDNFTMDLNMVMDFFNGMIIIFIKDNI